jgi:hypothetical protein
MKVGTYFCVKPIIPTRKEKPMADNEFVPRKSVEEAKVCGYLAAGEWL